ncbi:hypothetical protein EOM39_00730 [Candidatus Gracilibacteria bacterium]|nr:hypothetical protein [Candidatus Gracilibacteria bacterium]
MENITLDSLSEEINKIKDRNAKVEAEKAWETSMHRKISILILTYMIISLVMYFLDFDKPFLNAIIPTSGYLLSTLSISFLKKRYINKYTSKRG